MEFTRIHLLVLFVLAHGLTNRYILSYIGNGDEAHSHTYIANHYSEEEYEKWCEQQIKAELADGLKHQYGFELIQITRALKDFHKKVYEDGRNINPNDRVEFTPFWGNINTRGGWVLCLDKDRDTYAYSSQLKTVAPRRWHWFSGGDKPEEVAYPETLSNLLAISGFQEKIHHYFYKYFGGLFDTYYYEDYVFVTKEGKGLINPSLIVPYNSQGWLYETPAAIVIKSEVSFLDYCYENDIKVSYHNYYWSTFLRSLEGTGVHDFAWYMGDTMRAQLYGGYPEGSWWPIKQQLIEWDLTYSFDGFFFLVAGSNNGSRDLGLSNTFVKAHDFCRLPISARTANMDVFNIFV